MSQSPAPKDSSPHDQSRFATTCWTQVVAAKGETTGAKEALSVLCQDYYEPVVAYLGRAGYDHARDLAHGFFAELLKGGRLRHLERGRGRFRSYLLGALKHFLSHERAREKAAKRGGSASAYSLNETGAAPVEDESLPPDAWFDRQWALAVLSLALSEVEQTCRNEGKGEQFEVLSPWLTGDSDYGDQAAVAAKLGVSANTMKSLVHRMRRRFRGAVKQEVARTLPEDADVDSEMKSLFAALGG